MLVNVFRAIVLPILIYGSLYFLSLLQKRRTASQKTQQAKAEVPEEAQSVPVAQPVFPFADIHEVLIPGSALRYCKPFAPKDSLADIWCKLQTFVSAYPIEVKAGTSDSPPLLKSSFSPDGAVHSSAAMFADEFASGLRRRSWSAMRRQVRPLSSFGVPKDAAEGGYQIYTGPLLIELRGIHLDGMHCQIQAAFEPHLGLIPKHFAGSTSYLVCSMDSDDPSNSADLEVGPLTLVRLTLTFDAVSDFADTPEFIKDLKSRYGNYELYGYADTSGRSNQTSAIISDGIVVISISEQGGGATDKKAF